jgi:uncharacterized membrane protein
VILLVAALSLTGLGVSVYIWYKQATTGPVLCIGRGCATVIRSRYGRLLGVLNGAWGVGFFGGLLAATAAGALVPEWAPLVGRLSAIAAGIALILFIYLTYIQIRVLKALCSWCLTSAGLALAVFVLLVRAWGS